MNDIKELIGKTINKIHLDGSEDEIYFYCDDLSIYKLYHQRDCCEGVFIEDVCGEIEWLLDSPILVAECRTNIDRAPLNDWDDSYTWTFYELATLKGSVTIRWYGSSNGYYSERVDFLKCDLVEE